MPDPVVLASETLPEGVDLFRLADAPGFIVATERLSSKLPRPASTPR